MLGLIGFPLSHSRSPELFGKIFAEEGITDAMYMLFPMEDITYLREWIEDTPGLAGFNVTIPHKKAIIPMLDELSPEAEAIGAVNTVKIIRTGSVIRTKGYNTDYYGFKTSLKNFLGDNLPAKALILGTGGSSNTVAYVLDELDIIYKKVSRTNAQGIYSYDDITEDIVAQSCLIINTTPLGMYPAEKSFPVLPYHVLTPNHYLFDLVYNPEKTVFLQKGEENDAPIKNGLEMLELQARKAWEIWKA